MAGWKCYIIERAGLIRRSLRRYASGSECSLSPGPHSYHNAEVVIDPEAPEGADGGVTHTDTDEVDREDPRWLKACDCGYEFQADDHWQSRGQHLYRHPDGRLFALQDPDLPPGAMWDAKWMPHYAGPDGKAWTIRFPGGDDWLVFGPSSDGEKWAITGEAPRFTAHPSIGIAGRYHGFLKDGIITPDVDGKKFSNFPETA